MRERGRERVREEGGEERSKIRFRNGKMEIESTGDSMR